VAVQARRWDQGDYIKGKTLQPFDLHYWNSDRTNLALPTFTRYLRTLDRANSFRVPGILVDLGERVDLCKIDILADLMAAHEGHLVPWQGVHLSRRVLGGPSTFALATSGHITKSINPNNGLDRNSAHPRHAATRASAARLTGRGRFRRAGGGKVDARQHLLNQCRVSASEEAFAGGGAVEATEIIVVQRHQGCQLAVAEVVTVVIVARQRWRPSKQGTASTPKVAISLIHCRHRLMKGQTTTSTRGRLRSATLLASTNAVRVLPEPVAMAKTPRPPALLQARMASFW
jgi:hypothetical protein